MPQAAPPPQDDQPDNVVLQKFSGLKNVVTAERLSPEELEFAVNVDLDDVGQIHRRRGRTKVASGVFHSLFTSDDGVVFGVKDGSIGRLNSDYSFAALASGFSADPLAWVQVGPKIYFSSRSRAGIIDRDGDTFGPWGDSADLWYSPVVNPTANLPAIRGRLLGAPPLATRLAYYNGRIYLAHRRTVWATELYLYNFVDKTKNFWTFEADITMLGAVTDGLYVGTTEGVWFVAGPFAEAKRQRVMDSGVVPGSMTYVPGEVANPPQIRLDTDVGVKVSILFLTAAGYCGGQDSGVCYNYTESKFVFPGIASAAAVFRRQDGMNQYLVTGNSGGTPAANARIGDYVDAELVRGGGWNTLSDRVCLGDQLTWATS